jgi:hypothetical protein
MNTLATSAGLLHRSEIVQLRKSQKSIIKVVHVQTATGAEGC